MKHFRWYDNRVYQTLEGRRLSGYVRAGFFPDHPEERVRQSVLRSLVDHYGYPRSSLLAEEPVARGTKNRGRADILVELPKRFGPVPAIEVVGAESASSESVGYTERREWVAKRLHGSGIEVFELPKHCPLNMDGEMVDGRPLGFSVEGSGWALWCSAKGEGRPFELGFLVSGDYVARPERRLVKQLALPKLAMEKGASQELFDQCNLVFGLDFELGVELVDVRTRKAEHGWMLVRPSWSWLGVLVHADTSGEQWRDFSSTRLFDHIRAIPLDEARIAYRVSLDGLARGDHVYVIGGGHDHREGVVTGVDGSRHQVRMDDGERLALGTRPDAVKGAFIVGRTTDPDADGVEAAAEARPGEPTRTFIVVECKAPGVQLTTEVLNQGLRYARARGATLLVLANGDDAKSYLLRGDEAPEELEDIPEYEAATSSEAYAVRRVAERSRRHVPLPEGAQELGDLLRLHVRDRGDVVGVRTPSELWHPILAIDDLLRSATALFEGEEAGCGCVLTEDLGLRYHEPGNVVGSFPGHYRDLLMRTIGGEELVFGLKVNSYALGVGKTGKPVGGRTALYGCISTGATYHPVLALQLDKFLERRAGRWRLWHSGRGTIGRGATSSAKIRGFVAEHEPGLVEGDRVELGSFPADTVLTWRDVCDLILRLGRYTLLRHLMKERARRKRRK